MKLFAREILLSCCMLIFSTACGTPVPENATVPFDPTKDNRIIKNNPTIACDMGIADIFWERIKTEKRNKTLDAPPTPEELKAINNEKILIGFESCSASMKKLILEGFRDAVRVLGYVKDWRDFKVDWRRPAAVEFFGGAARTQKYRQVIQSNLGRMSRLFNAKDPAGTIFVTCADPWNRCQWRNGPPAYVPDYNPNKKGNSYINFCVKWSNVEHLDDLIEFGNKIYNLNKLTGSGAYIILHELFHLVDIATAHPDNLVSNPRNKILQIRDINFPKPIDGENRKAVGPRWAKELANGAKNWDPWLVSGNADNYAWWAISEFLHRDFKLYPFQPVLDDPWQYSRGSNQISTGTKDLTPDICSRTNETVGGVGVDGKMSPIIAISPDECFDGVLGTATYPQNVTYQAPVANR
ncbi:hypothetical protein TWF694_011610 [Orbilia ellipsospora]|uniref:Lysine-specific metallo-endopeptidase domain-containing protein n=1 Tax=Orbilia ellipsospora TaxID=2528407 RepID=A0AAV9XBY4_9PEZI